MRFLCYSILGACDCECVGDHACLCACAGVCVYEANLGRDGLAKKRAGGIAVPLFQRDCQLRALYGIASKSRPLIPLHLLCSGAQKVNIPKMPGGQGDNMARPEPVQALNKCCDAEFVPFVGQIGRFLEPLTGPRFLEPPRKRRLGANAREMSWVNRCNEAACEIFT